MRIYVVGDKGYIGSNLVLYLESKGHIVFGNDSYGDIGCVINCAQKGMLSGKDSMYSMINSNILFPMQLIDRKYKHMIHLSSSSEIFQPQTAYSRTKSLASDYLRGKATLCYLYTVWGGINQHPHTFMAALLKAKREGLPFHLETPYATRDFVHIKHVCRGIEELIYNPIGEYHFGTGKARLMKDVSDMAGVKYTMGKDYRTFTWKAANPYFPDTFKEDLQGEP